MIVSQKDTSLQYNRYTNCKVCGKPLLPQSIYDCAGFCCFCYPLDGDFENVLSGKLVYSHISGENQKNLAFPLSTASLYKEVQFVTGDFVEQYCYSRPLIKNSSALFNHVSGNKSSTRQHKKKTDEELEQYREELRERKKTDLEFVKKQLNRKKKTIRRLINTNCRKDNKFLCSFFTATYKDNELDEYKAREDFNKFIKRLQYAYPLRTDLKLRKELSFENYIACLERQERGAIHFHVIFFNCPYLHYSEFSRIWGHGSIDVHAIKKVHRVGSYVVKYLTNAEKHQLDNPILGKTWVRSQDLELPIRLDFKDYQDLSSLKCLFQSNYTIPDTDISVIYTFFERFIPPN